MTYLITWCCYGSHVPGEEGIVFKHNNHFGTRVAGPNVLFARASRSAMTDEAFDLDSEQRQIVLKAILDVGHVVIYADVAPERIMQDLKSYASRALNRAQHNWARHGSTRYLYTRETIINAVCYVVEKQGEPMAVHMEPRQ